MRKLGLILPLLIVLMASASSCKKCHVCTVLDEDNNTIFNYPEVCGTNNDLDAYRERCESEYGPFDFNCSCGPRE